MFWRGLKTRALVMGPVMLFVFVYSNFIQDRRDPLAYVKIGDPQIEAARAEARETLPTFLARLKNPTADESHFVVKFRLERSQVIGFAQSAPSAPTHPEPAEFIWARMVTLTPDSSSVTGLIDGDPRSKGFHNGQPVRIPLDDVVDWGYKKAGVVQGNFTTRVLLAKLPPEQAARAKQAFGWRD